MARQAKLRPGIELISLNNLPGSDLPEGTKSVFWGTANIHAKVQEPDEPFLIANEFIGSRLAIAIGLPGVPGEIASFEGKKVWITPQIADDGHLTAPPNTKELEQSHPSIVAGIQVFDIWVANEDRHAGNVLFAPKIGPSLIDHDAILAGAEGNHINNSLDEWVDQYQFLGAATRDTPAVKEWCQKIQHMHQAIVPGIVTEAYKRGFLDASSRDKYIKVLHLRGSKITDLVDVYLDRSRGIKKPKEKQLDIFEGDESE